jgi:hypothetical protein
LDSDRAARTTRTRQRRCRSPETRSRGGATPAMAKLGRPGFVWLGTTPWRKLAVRVIHPGYHRGGSGLGWAIPAARAARGGGHAGVRAFRAQSSPNHYGFRCITTRQGRGSSPRACEGRSCRGGRTPTTTGGGNGAALADSSAWCSSRPAGPPNHHVQAL